MRAKARGAALRPACKYKLDEPENMFPGEETLFGSEPVKAFLLSWAKPQTSNLAALESREKETASTTVPPGGPAERHPVEHLLFREREARTKSVKSSSTFLLRSMVHAQRQPCKSAKNLMPYPSYQHHHLSYSPSPHPHPCSPPPHPLP